MKTLKKVLGIIVIGMIIGLVLSCTTVEQTPEDAAFDNALRSAKWNVRALPSQPSFNGFTRLSSSAIDFTFFQSFGRRFGDPEIAINTWYELTSSDLPGVTYLTFRQSNSGGAISALTVYKR